MGHALMVGALSPERMRDIKDKRMASAAVGRQRRNDTKGDIGKDIVSQCHTGEDGRLKVNANVLEAMGLNTQCDLKYEYTVFKALNMNPGVQQYDEKMAFSRWLETPEHLRVPSTMQEAADILGMSTRSLMGWKTSPDIINFINQDVESRIGGLYKMCIYRLGEGIDRGDKGCFEIFLKHFKEKQDATKSKRKGLLVPLALQKEADEHATLTEAYSREGVALKTEKEAINAKYFSDTLGKKEEISQ